MMGFSYNRVRDGRDMEDVPEPYNQTQPVGAPTPMPGAPQQGGQWGTQPVGPPMPMQGGGENQTQPVGPPAPMQGQMPQGQTSWMRSDGTNTWSGTGQMPSQMPPPQGRGLPGISTAKPQGMSLYGLGGVPGYAPASWLQPQGRQMAGPWNPFQGRMSGMVRG